jgi:ABC-2 type transport system permease protein
MNTLSLPPTTTPASTTPASATAASATASTPGRARSRQRRAAFRQVVLNETRLTWRRPVGLIAGVALPLLLLIIFGNLTPFKQHLATFGGGTIFDAYVPILTSFALAMLALLGLPLPLGNYRELGVLRRLSTTPVPPSWVLAAQALVQGCIAVVTVIVIMVVSTVAFGVPAPKSPAGLVVSVLIAIAGLAAIGLLIAAVSKTSTSASVIGRVAFFPLMFFAGLWLPRAEMPPVLFDISNYTPLGAAVQAIQASMQAGFPPAAPLLVLAGYAVVFGYLARRFFRWE